MSKRKLAALVGEVVGTFVLTLVVLSINRYGLPIFTALSAGAAIGTMYGIFGGHFNPAITLGFFSTRRIGLLKTVMFIAAQAVGAVLAWKLYEWFIGRSVPLASSEFDWKIFVAEMIGAFIFAVGYAAAVRSQENTQRALYIMGSTFFLGASMASLISAAGTLNPAVAIALGFRPENAGYLAYLFGPVVGAVVGMNFYSMGFLSKEKKPAMAAVSVASSPAPAKAKTSKKPAKRGKK